MRAPPTTDANFAINKSNLVFSGYPSFTFTKNDFSIDLGAELTYLARLKNTFAGVDLENDSKFFVYPKVKLSYKVVGDLMVFVAGADGGLQQNTYENFVTQNKFFSLIYMHCKITVHN